MSAVDYRSFFGGKVLAFTSDAMVDFLKGVPQEFAGFELTQQQRDWLSTHGVSSPEKVIFPKQVHGNQIWCVTSKDIPQRGIYEADALVTGEPGLLIAIRTADCVPVLLFDSVHNVIAAVHAGWRSTQGRIIVETISVMHKKWGTESDDLRAVIGPCIRRDSYEVGPEFENHFPFDVSLSSGRRYLDLAAANARQLKECGIDSENIFDCGRDTFTDVSFHSFRRDGERSGRMLTGIQLSSFF